MLLPLRPSSAGSRKRLLPRGATGLFELIAVALWISLPAGWGLLLRLFRRPLPRSRQVGRTAGTNRPITPLFMRIQSVVEMISLLGLSWFLGSLLFQEG
jgi:hypothetical protein